MFMNKAAGKGTWLPWHQDRWRVLDTDPLLNVYLAIDAATPESGCMQVVPASHKLGVLNPAHHSAFLTDEQIAEHCEGGQAVDLPLAAGEVVLMHNWVIHSSGVNRTDG